MANEEVAARLARGCGSLRAATRTRLRTWVVPPRPKGREMGKAIVMNWVKLDGVMQGPGHPDEDTRDGFAGALAVS